MIQRPRKPIPERDATERIASFAEVERRTGEEDAYERGAACYRIYSIVTAKSLKNGNENGHATAHEQQLTATAG